MPVAQISRLANTLLTEVYLMGSHKAGLEAFTEILIGPQSLGARGMDSAVQAVLNSIARLVEAAPNTVIAQVEYRDKGVLSFSCRASMINHTCSPLQRSTDFSWEPKQLDQ